MSKVKCFICHDFGQYVEKKRKVKQHALTTNVDDDDNKNTPWKKTKESKLDKIAVELQKEYFIVSSMTGSRDSLTDLIEKDSTL